MTETCQVCGSGIMTLGSKFNLQVVGKWDSALERLGFRCSVCHGGFAPGEKPVEQVCKFPK
jgi:hypothetical protein